MKLVKVTPASMGPRGSIVLRACMTIEDDGGTRIFVMADCPAKWTAKHTALFDEVVLAIQNQGLPIIG